MISQGKGRTNTSILILLNPSYVKYAADKSYSHIKRRENIAFGAVVARVRFIINAGPVKNVKKKTPTEMGRESCT